MLFSKACQYAILAMIHLAAQGTGKRLSIREIGEGAQVPTPFLGKIVSTLVRANLISARRGPNGGAILSRSPDEVTVGDIVEAVDGPLDGQRCILGMPACSDLYPCPLHTSWKQIEERLNKDLHGLTLSELTQSRRRNV